MTDTDPATRQKLTRLAERRSVDVEADLRTVIERGRSGVPRGRNHFRTGVAVVVALGLSVPVVIGRYLLARGGREDTASPGAGDESAAPQSAIPTTWGGALASSSGEDGVQISSRDGTQTLPFPGAILSPSGPAGGVYTFLGARRVIWYPDGRTVEVRPPSPGLYQLGPSVWSPDGQSLAIEGCTYEGKTETGCSILVVSAADGSSSELVPSNSQGVSWSPDGSQIAYIAPSRALSLVDVASGTVREVLPRGAWEDLFRPLWSPSGAFIAVIADEPGGRVPIVVDLDGLVVGRGEITPGGLPPVLVWREGVDELLHAHETDDPNGPRVTLWAMTAPGWSSRLLLDMPGQGRPGLWISPDGRAVLLQTSEPVRAAITGHPFRWTVLDLTSGTQEVWDLLDAQVIDWE